jgi:hypothetical protein
MTEPQRPAWVPPTVAATTGGPRSEAEPKTGLLRLPWLHWPYVIVLIVPLVLVLAAAAWAWPGLLARVQLGDYRAAERHVREFAWPSGMQDDPTLTACGGFGTRCARADIGPEAALRATAGALGGAGVRLDPVRCGADVDLLLAALVTPQATDCAAVGHAGGFSVQAFATKYGHNLPDAGAVPLGYTQVSVRVTPENPRLGELVGEPSVLGTDAPLPLRISEVPGLPASFSSMTCTQPVTDGCRQFDGTMALADPSKVGIDAAAARLADQLRGGGYRVDLTRCRETEAGRRCTVAGQAYRTAGGRDLTSVVAILSSDPTGGLSVRAGVSAR